MKKGNKIFKKILQFVLLVGILSSCYEQKTLEQLFEERASGVVVILNEFYYEFGLPNGNKVYFTGIDSDGNLENFTPDEEQIKKNCQIMTGTVFLLMTKELL